MSPAEQRSSYLGGGEHVPPDGAYRKVSRDPVTGVLNPQAFLAIVNYTVDRAERAERETALLFVHLPEPTRQLVGDERLFQLVARFLRKTLRGEDAIGRFGNAFVVLASDADAAGAEVAATRLGEGLWQNLGLAIAGRWEIEITMSVPGESGRDLIDRATASEPGLAEALLPKERHSFVRLRPRG